MITMDDALRLIEERRDDAIVLPTMTGTPAWQRVSNDEPLDVPVNGGMGKASSIALGICLAQPDKKVIVLDGDGSLVMNLGSLVTIGGQAPGNLIHCVLNNWVYGVTGGQPIPNAGGFSFADMARGAGYAASFEFDDLEDFATHIDEIMSAEGPVFVSLRTEPEIETTPVSVRPPRTLGVPQALKELHKTLNG